VSPTIWNDNVLPATRHR